MTIQQVARIFWATLIRFDSNYGWPKSSLIAMSIMLAIFPFTIFALSLTQAVSAEYLTPTLVEFIYGTWPDNIAEPIVKEVMAVLQDSSIKTMTIGGLLAIFFASSGVDAVRFAITDAYREQDPRPFWKTRALCILFVFCGSVILTIAAILVFLVPLYFNSVYGNVEMHAKNIPSYNALRLTISFILLIFSVFACHMWLPVKRRAVKQVFPGVFLTVFFWAVAGKGFALYVEKFSSYSITYAGLAGVMAALVFLYFMAIIFVVGAEFNGRLIAFHEENSVKAAKI